MSRLRRASDLEKSLLSRRQLFGLAGSAALIGAGADAEDAAVNPPNEFTPRDFPAIDQAGVADRIVAALAPNKGERAVLLYDPDYYPGIAQALVQRLTEAGVDAIVPVTVEKVTRSAGESRDQYFFREQRAFEMLAPLVRTADLLPWLPGDTMDIRWERSIEASNARSVHCHFVFGPFNTRSRAEIDTLCRLYEHAILHTDYRVLSRHMDGLIERIRGRTLRISAPNGTDLRIDVPAEAWFHKSDGDMSLARARTARAVRDREIELPGGALRFLPAWQSARGRVVANVVSTAQKPDTVTLDFSHGLLTQVAARDDTAAFEKLLAWHGGDIHKVAEIVLGCNPALVPQTPLPSGEPPYYGFGAGALRVSLGDNWESGGPLRTIGYPVWTFVPNASISADSDRVLIDGKFA